MRTSITLFPLALLLAGTNLGAQTLTPTGEIMGKEWSHTQESLQAAIDQADVCIPAATTGSAEFMGKFKDIPPVKGQPIPVVIFMHGSSGLSLKAIGEWQRWLCGLGYASVAPDSFALPGRVTYKSPIDKASYEKIHALRASEIQPALEALNQQPWADKRRLVLAGSSEGAVPVARYTGTQFAARMLFAWSCESNYFVTSPLNAFETSKPVLNVISTTDPYFSKANPWLGNPEAQGHCGAALASNPKARLVLVPNAPHTLLNLPEARKASAEFLAGL